MADCLDVLPWFLVVLFRALGPKHLQVAHGDVSVPERGAAADDLAGVPSGRDRELPEQGGVTMQATITMLVPTS